MKARWGQCKIPYADSPPCKVVVWMDPSKQTSVSVGHSILGLGVPTSCKHDGAIKPNSILFVTILAPLQEEPVHQEPITNGMHRFEDQLCSKALSVLQEMSSLHGYLGFSPTIPESHHAHKSLSQVWRCFMIKQALSTRQGPGTAKSTHSQ